MNKSNFVKYVGIYADELGVSGDFPPSGIDPDKAERIIADFMRET